MSGSYYEVTTEQIFERVYKVWARSPEKAFEAWRDYFHETGPTDGEAPVSVRPSVDQTDKGCYPPPTHRFRRPKRTLKYFKTARLPRANQ